MSSITVRPVRSRSERQIFLTFPWRIYRADPLWVPPLLPERRKLLEPARSEYLSHSQAELFIAWQGSQPVGTISAAEDFTANRLRDSRECVIGFFECIEQPAVAAALFDAAAAWAAARGLDTLRGPFNFDYEDGYGILIEGRDRPPALLCGHTPAYYHAFWEDYGFTPLRGDNLAFALEIRDTPQIQSLFQMAERARTRLPYRIRSARLEEWDLEIDRVHHLLNQALAHLPDHTPWQREAVVKLFSPFRQLADPELVLFAEDEDQVIGFFPGISNLNEAFIHANGLRHPWNYLSLLRRIRQPTRCLAVKSILVLPEYWGSGLVILLFAELYRRAAARGYQWMDFSLTSEDNPRTPALARRFGAEVYKRYRVYSKKIR